MIGNKVFCYQKVCMYIIIKMQLTAAEDLLRNTENLAIVIGDVLDASSGNISNSSMTITQENIGMCTLNSVQQKCICIL